MAASTFNPLEAARALEATGVDRRQAEALRQAATADRDELATKADLAALKADLAALEARMTANLYRALWFQGGAIIAILTALRFLTL